MNSLLVLGLSAAAVIQNVSAKVLRECTNEEKSLLIIRNGLDNFKELNKAGDKKVSFLVKTSELEQAKVIAKKNGSRAVVWSLTKGDLKRARKYHKKSKKLKSEIKKLMKAYKKETKKTLKIVTLPSGTSSKIVKAFEKKKITVIKAARKASKVSKTKKLIKKAKKATKKGELTGGITFFTANAKNGPKQLKKLRKALKKVVNAEKCFKALKKEKIENEGEELPVTESQNQDEGVLKSGSFDGFDMNINFAGNDDVEIIGQTVKKDFYDDEEEEEEEDEEEEEEEDDEEEGEKEEEEKEEGNNDDEEEKENNADDDNVETVITDVEEVFVPSSAIVPNIEILPATIIPEDQQAVDIPEEVFEPVANEQINAPEGVVENAHAPILPDQQNADLTVGESAVAADDNI